MSGVALIGGSCVGRLGDMTMDKTVDKETL